MKTLLDSIKQRRSIFPASYTGEPIAIRDLNQILEAGRWAPNHKKTEPWRYVVITGDARVRLSEFMTSQKAISKGKPKSFKIKRLKEKFKKSTAIILIFMHRDPKERIPEWEEIAAVSMSVQNMWLTAHDLGHGCYWSSPKKGVDMSQFDGVPATQHDSFLGFLYLGKVDEQPSDLPDRKSLDEVVTFLES
ncbi:nitroreductase family protein [Nonlabens ponticola]|uniref:Putative NAD(P)H nitroreductase n=1 Tax=Nonlabens ponticola TaxID=2496866 RepID=A0A3S9MYA5_9FLAO|nr:nitroreductase [Nonlabens ponticola]AZQ44119.1 nitroreductase [Nonlabens ponticola]